MDATPREIPLEATKERKRRHWLADLFVRLVKEKPLGTVGGVIVLILLLVGIFADFLAPYGYNDIHLPDRLSPSSVEYILGTDHMGRDLLSRIIYGARVSMIVGLAGAAIDVALAAIIGLISGFLGGKTDLIIQRFIDAWMCLPPLAIYLTLMAIVGQGIIQVLFVLGVTSGIRQSRIIRSAVIAIKQNLYVEAAKAIGAPARTTLIRHILPNVMAPIIIVFTMGIGHMILQEATLSFLGFGVPPPMPSWGSMLSKSGRRYMLTAPWMAFWPGLALATVVYGVNMLGDAVRDLLDPRLRGGLGRYGGMEKKRTKMLERTQKTNSSI